MLENYAKFLVPPQAAKQSVIDISKFGIAADETSLKLTIHTDNFWTLKLQTNEITRYTLTHCTTGGSLYVDALLRYYRALFMNHKLDKGAIERIELEILRKFNVEFHGLSFNKIVDVIGLSEADFASDNNMVFYEKFKRASFKKSIWQATPVRLLALAVFTNYQDFHHDNKCLWAKAGERWPFAGGDFD